MHQSTDQAREEAYRLRDIFGKGNFFLEIQDQGLEIERRVNPRTRAAVARDAGFRWWRRTIAII